MELYLHFPDMPSWGGAYLKHRENFTFYTESQNPNRTVTHNSEFRTVTILYYYW